METARRPPASGPLLDLEASENHVRRRIAAVGRIDRARMRIFADEAAHAGLEVLGERDVVDVAGAQLADIELVIRHWRALRKQFVLLRALGAGEERMGFRETDGRL